MHQRKLHLLALYESDLLASRLNDTLSLWVRRKSLQWQCRVRLKGAQWLCVFCLIPCLLRMSNEALFKEECGAGIEQGFCLYHYLKTVSKMEGRCHFLTSSPSSLTKCIFDLREKKDC